MSPRSSLLAVPVALLLYGPSIGAAQTPSFRDLALIVNLGDQLDVEDQSGATATGRLLRLTDTEITIQTGSGERRFGVDVSSISVGRRSMREAVLIGAGLGAVGGLVAACTGPDREECPDAGLLLGAVGAGAGVVVSALRPGWSTVYSADEGIVAGVAAGPPGPLDLLALHVNLGDRLRVRAHSGATIRGRLTGLTGDEITLETESGEMRVASASIDTVGVRGYALREGALIGAGALTAFLFMTPGCRDDPDCIPLLGAPLGAGVGVAVGALVPRMKTVFRAEEPRVRFVPVLSPRSMGVRAILRW